MALLIWVGLGWSLPATGQDCLDGYTPRDTVTMRLPLGKCEWEAQEILAHLAVDQCIGLTLSVSSVGINQSRIVDLIDELTNEIIDNFVVIVYPDPGFVPELIEIELGTNECRADKDLVLDQLNVDTAQSVRSNIHFISGTSRLTTFAIGDTIYIDRILCGEGYLFTSDIKIHIAPEVTLPDDLIITYNKGFSTQDATLEEILASYPFWDYGCDLSRYTFNDRGPWGYGQYAIGDIMLDSAVLARNVSINVVPPTCPPSLLHIPLDTNQCYINEADILEALGFDPARDDFNRIELTIANGQQYENERFFVESIRVDNFPICTQEIEVSYQRHSSIIEELSNFACNNEINVSLDSSCQAIIQADMILEGDPYCYLNYELRAINRQGQTVAQDHQITLTETGRYTVHVINNRTNTSCSAVVNIEDKHMPRIAPRKDTVYCVFGIRPDTLPGHLPFPDVGADSQFDSIGPNEYFVINDDACGIKYAWYSDRNIDTCVGNTINTIYRTWTFRDDADNIRSKTDTIHVLRVLLDSIDNFKSVEISCLTDFEYLDKNGYPSPRETGYPTVRDSAFRADRCGTINTTYHDQVVPGCGVSKKIAREWVIIDWCNSDVITKFQTLNIVDKTPPSITTPAPDIAVPAHPYHCGAEDIMLTLPMVEDCDTVIKYGISYETLDQYGRRQIIDNDSSLLIPSIRMESSSDSFRVFYTIADRCGNISYDTAWVRIDDTQSPNAICDLHTVVSVTGNGTAQVRALTFDDLSIDNCTIAHYEARKMTGACRVEEEFAETIYFCCEEVGETILVEFKVTDEAGNSNSCMVEVEVTDKFTPIINCPPNITLNCTTDYQNTAITGEPRALDNCMIDSLLYTDDVSLNACGVGTIRRTWRAIDRGGLSASCVQFITIVDSTPFEMRPMDFPPDIEVEGCQASLDTAITGRPTLHNTTCADIRIRYEDEAFGDSDGCDKILRHWTVLDWCQYDNDTVGIWRRSQVIKIKNNIAPIITAIPQDTAICQNERNEDCESLIKINAQASDDCTPSADINWFYVLYADSTRQEMLKTGSTAQFSDMLQSGRYYIVFTAADGCGNQSEYGLSFEVTDCTAPDIICQDRETPLSLQQDGMLLLSLDSLFISWEEECDPNEEITLSFASDTLLTTWSFDCADLDNGINGKPTVTVYATDAAGNQDACTIEVPLRDHPDDSCMDSLFSQNQYSVTGEIRTSDNRSVDQVKVILVAPNQQETQLTTAGEGQYAFENLPASDQYAIRFERDINPQDGVNILDLIMIQRHILGLAPLETAYQVIASDVNNDRRVNGADIADIRRLILNNISRFQNGQQSWRFVRKEHEFENQIRVFPYPERISITELQNDLRAMDMIAIKIGDVNNSNHVSSVASAFSRTPHPIHTLTAKEDILHGEKVWGVYAGRNAPETLEALQLFIPTRGLNGVLSGQLHIDASQYNSNSEGVQIVWHDNKQLEAIDLAKPLFYLTQDSKALSSDTPLITPTIDATKNLWVANNEDIYRLHIETVETHENPWIVGTPAPNPFTDDIRLDIEVNQPDQCNITVHDLKGQVLYMETKPLYHGRNTIRLSGHELGHTQGVLILRVQNEEFVHSFKIIRM